MLTYFKRILIIILQTVLSQIAFGTTWSAAYPYTQQIEGQNVVIKAFPFAPYSGSPMIGVTKVYFKKKLLYTIGKYYRERIFTSNDGQYLVVVRTSNSAGLTSYTSFAIEQINFNQTAIEVFKNGLLFRTFTLKDVIDTTKLANNGQFFNWGYTVNFKAFDNASWDCEYWGKNLTRREKRECINGDTTFYCKEWINGCDSMKIFERGKFICTNSIYVQGNSLFVLTNQGIVVKLDFSKMSIERILFDMIVTDKQSFNPPKLNRKYKTVKLPEKFDEPNLKDGRPFEKAVADLFGLSVLDSNERNTFSVFINYLVLDTRGKCVDFYGNVYDERILEGESVNIEMTEKLNKWVKEQSFQTDLIPKGFDGYSFLCIVDLK